MFGVFLRQLFAKKPVYSVLSQKDSRTVVMPAGALLYHVSAYTRNLISINQVKCSILGISINNDVFIVREGLPQDTFKRIT